MHLSLLTDRGPSTTWKYFNLAGAISYANSVIPPPAPTPPPSPPAPTPSPMDIGGITFSLWDDSFTIRALNKSVAAGSSWGAKNNASFVPNESPRPGCHNLGDITVRVRPSSPKGGDWAIYSSADATSQVASQVAGGNSNTLVAHDISELANATNVDPR